MTGVKLRWALGGLAGWAVAVLCLVELNLHDAGLSNAAAQYGLAGALGTAVAVSRPWPAVSLGMAWLAGLMHVVGHLPVLLSDAVLVVAVFAAARWGRRVTVALGAVTVALGPLLAYVLWMVGAGPYASGPGGRLLNELIVSAGAEIHPRSLAIVGLALLAVPWLLGLTLRYVARAEAAQRATVDAEAAAAQAREIARLQAEQTRLARDVHDVVGHSLAVILAQAESAQYVDSDELQRTMRNIAASARASLQDVRAVLTSTQDLTGDLDDLIDGVRQSGRAVESSRTGRVQPLPPELAAVAYRVLQEMLTNAIKHGDAAAPITVVQAWPEPDTAASYLRLEVTNPVGPPTQLPPGDGLDGMRRRLDSVGGHVQIARADGVFTATARLPVRPATEGLLA